ncbi:MAG: hypothetical protein WBL85_06255 [Sedimentisphaerales bacterium]
MARVISFEDHKWPQKRLLTSCEEKVPGIVTNPINYKDEQGVAFLPSVVAGKANNLVDGPTVFLVDLVRDPHELDVTYGLRVIRELIGKLVQDGSGIPEFLKRNDMLVCAVTGYPDKLNKDKDKVLEIIPSSIEIKIAYNRDDVALILKDRKKRPILPVIIKAQTEALLPELINGWVESL